LRFLSLQGLNDDNCEKAIDLLTASFPTLKQLRTLEIMTKMLSSMKTFDRLFLATVFPASSSLKYLQLHTTAKGGGQPFHQVSHLQSTLKCVRFLDIAFDFEDLAYMFPTIQSVTSLSLVAFTKNWHTLAELPRLKSLNIKLTHFPDYLLCEERFEDLRILLKKTVNLVNLTVRVQSYMIRELPHSSQWSYFLSSPDHVAKLRKVQLYMCYSEKDVPTNVVEWVKRSYIEKNNKNGDYWKKRSVQFEHRTDEGTSPTVQSLYSSDSVHMVDPIEV
jgi:hypothetical protein